MTKRNIKILEETQINVISVLESITCGSEYNTSDAMMFFSEAQTLVKSSYLGVKLDSLSDEECQDDDTDNYYDDHYYDDMAIKKYSNDCFIKDK